MRTTHLMGSSIQRRLIRRWSGMEHHCQRRSHLRCRSSRQSILPSALARDDGKEHRWWLECELVPRVCGQDDLGGLAWVIGSHQLVCRVGFHGSSGGKIAWMSESRKKTWCGSAWRQRLEHRGCSIFCWWLARRCTPLRGRGRLGNHQACSRTSSVYQIP